MRRLSGAAVGAAIVAVLAGVTDCAAADQFFSKQGSIEAHLPGGFRCSPRVRVKLVAPTEAAFSSERKTVERLVGAVQSALRFRCKSITDIVVTGYGGDKPVFSAISSKSTQWTLVDIPLELALSKDKAEPTEPLPKAPIARSEPPTKDPANGARGKSGVLDLALPPKPSKDREDAGGKTTAAPEVRPAKPTEPQSAGIEQFRRLDRSVKKGSFPLGNYNFSGLVSALYHGELKTIPDDQRTRSVVYSIFKALIDNCGQAPTNVVAAAARYGVPQMRELEKNPLGVLGDMMRRTAQMRDSGDFLGGISQMAKKYGSFVVEGIEDGRVFVGRHGCPGSEYAQFRDNVHRVMLRRSSSEPDAYDEIEHSRMMSPALRAKLGIKDPAIALRERKLVAFYKGGEKACNSEFDSSTFCSCAINKLKTANLSDEIWQKIGAGFRSIAKYPDTRPLISACY